MPSPYMRREGVKEQDMKRIGCQCASEQEWSRRDFIKVGSLGFLGMHLSQSLMLELKALPTQRQGNAQPFRMKKRARSSVG